MNIQIAGENALIIYVDEQNLTEQHFNRSEKVQQVYQAIKQSLMKDNGSGMVIDLVPSYASILVIFDLFKCDHHQLRQQLRACITKLPLINKGSNTDNKVIELPAYYAEEVGIDLDRIAKHAKLSIAEVIDIHQACEYHVYAIGFAPGFAYLGDVDQRIAMPRLASPRQKVPQGAIAIADRQTAVYPKQSPGGWNIIGLCPVKMFDVSADPMMPVQVGDKVKFKSIDKVNFLALGGVI